MSKDLNRKELLEEKWEGKISWICDEKNFFSLKIQDILKVQDINEIKDKIIIKKLENKEYWEFIFEFNGKNIWFIEFYEEPEKKSIELSYIFNTNSNDNYGGKSRKKLWNNEVTEIKWLWKFMINYFFEYSKKQWFTKIFLYSEDYVKDFYKKIFNEFSEKFNWEYYKCWEEFHFSFK